MGDLFSPIKKKVNNIIVNLSISGILLLVLGVLIVWTDFVLRLVVGIVVIIISYMFFYAAHRLYAIKQDIEKYFKI